MNILPALAYYLQQHIPECYWMTDRVNPATIISYAPIPYHPNAIKLKATITQLDNLLQITNLDYSKLDRPTKSNLSRNYLQPY